MVEEPILDQSAADNQPNETGGEGTHDVPTTSTPKQDMQEATEKGPRLETQSGTQQFVTFIAGDEVFAADMSPVKEIIRVPEVVRVPLAPTALEGLANLRGKVLPIGGMKEKLLAAHRMGLRTVLLPKDNEKDLAEIPQEILSSLKLHFVETVDEVLQIALERPIVPLEHIAVAPVTEALASGADKDKSLTN